MKYTLWQILKQNNQRNIVFYGVSQSECQLTLEEKEVLNAFYMDLDLPIIADPNVFIDTLDKAVNRQIDAFIVMRQMISNQKTFLDLLEYSEKYGAVIYDDNGRNIGDICLNAMKCERCNREALQKEMLDHEYISFDIFDTLLTRKVLVPEDVFELTARRLEANGIVIPDFKNKRKKAQEVLGLCNPDLDQIYEEFKSRYDVTEEVTLQCRNTEVEIEEEVLIPRKDMVEFFKECISNGKKVSLVSDMYISGDVVKTFLEKNGIEGYQNLYISCDKKRLKLQGLLEIYRSEIGDGRFLHIGDHLIHDGVCAGLAGIDYCLIANGYDMALKTAYFPLIGEAENLEERMMLGLSIAKVLNSPFSMAEEDSKIFIRSDYDYSYGFCAAILCKYVLWLYYEAQKGNFRDILFGSRDGYLIQKMYNILREKEHDADVFVPEGKYFYISRKAAVMTCTNNEPCFNMLINMLPQLEPEKMMKERFNLDENQILPYDAQKYSTIHQYVCAHVDAVFKRADEARYNYYKYMRSINMEMGVKYAFMDFVSSGTCQRFLAKIAPFEIVGFYVGNSNKDQEDIIVKSMFKDKTSFFMKHYKIIETFMTSEEASLSHFDEGGAPVFQEQERSAKEISYVGEMQNGILDFFLDFLNIMEGKIENIRNTFLDAIFSVSASAVIENEECELNNISLMDDWVQVRLNKEQII